MRITKDLVERYGPTDDCHGCYYAQGLRNYASHNEICRNKMMDRILNYSDVTFQERVNKDIERMAGKVKKTKVEFDESNHEEVKVKRVKVTTNEEEKEVKKGSKNEEDREQVTNKKNGNAGKYDQRNSKKANV